MSTQDVADRYYAAVADKGAGLSEVLAADFSFTGPMVQTRSSQEFLEAASGMFSTVDGVSVRRQWTDGRDVCTIYDLETSSPAGRFACAEWLRIVDDAVAEATLVFDTSVMAATQA
jgi:hypothetical protein